MNKHLNRSVEILLVIFLFLLMGFSVWQNFQIKRLKYTMRDFAIVNEIPIAYEVKERKKIRLYAEGAEAPEALILAIGMSEKGLGSHTFGVKKIRLDTMIGYPIDDWQLVDCIAIVKQEMYKYCEAQAVYFRSDKEMLEYINTQKKAFMYQLAGRYCPINQEVWFKNVLSNWKKFERESQKEGDKNADK
jgi:hypothetical protein